MSIQILIEALREFLVLIPSILIAITIHEFTTGYVAYKLGDTTPVDTGLLKFNPFNFIDALGLIFFIIFGYGWSKNIPVDYRNFKKPVLWYFYSELSGILSNLFVALFFILLVILYKPAPDGYIYNLFMNIIKINLNYFLICFFPVLPLSVGRLITVIWYNYSKTEFWGLLFLFIFFIFGGNTLLDKIVAIFIKIIE